MDPNKYVGKTISRITYRPEKCGGNITLVEFTDGSSIFITDGIYDEIIQEDNK